MPSLGLGPLVNGNAAFCGVPDAEGEPTLTLDAGDDVSANAGAPPTVRVAGDAVGVKVAGEAVGVNVAGEAVGVNLAAGDVVGVNVAV